MTVHHFTIEKLSRGKKAKYRLLHGKKFDSVPDLILFYKTNIVTTVSRHNNIRLQYPIKRPVTELTDEDDKPLVPLSTSSTPKSLSNSSDSAIAASLPLRNTVSTTTPRDLPYSDIVAIESAMGYSKRLDHTTNVLPLFDMETSSLYSSIPEIIKEDIPRYSYSVHKQHRELIQDSPGHKGKGYKITKVTDKRDDYLTIQASGQRSPWQKGLQKRKVLSMYILLDRKSHS